MAQILNLFALYRLLFFRKTKYLPHCPKCRNRPTKCIFAVQAVISRLYNASR